MADVRLLVVDDGEGRWGPLTDLRPIFAARAGVWTLLERMERITGLKAAAVDVAPDLAGVTAEMYPGVAVNTEPDDGDWLVMSGRLAEPQAIRWAARLQPGQELVDEAGRILAHRGHQHGDRLVYPGSPLIERPWHLLDRLETDLADDLEHVNLPTAAAPPGVIRFGDHPLKLHPNAKLSPGCVIDTTLGVVGIDCCANIGPTAVLQGPCWIGKDSVIVPGALIRPGVVLGPSCKVGGELSQSILWGYDNKTHGGYLGHALVGAWVNFGAATNVSNLKNTYGHVRVQLDDQGPRENTGRQYLGPLVGDFVRTAIGSRLMTGSVIGSGCMIALSGFAPTYAPRLGFHTDAGRQPHDVEALISTAKLMMQRRQMTLCPAMEARLRNLA
ncbi:MAG: hypothetical protein IT440_09785 [Phycisphaeraceae bacterium]|nr:hypothetical protein [Phycisphaeraceae bacterium]